MSDEPVSPLRPTRRDALRILAVGSVGGLILGGGWLRRRGLQTAERSSVLMGTTVRITVLDPDRERAETAADAMLEKMSGVESLLSGYRADSELFALNSTGRVDRASEALLDVLRLADRVSDLGEGRFDVTVQPLLDLYRRNSGLPADTELEQALDQVGYRKIRIDGSRVEISPGVRITLDGIGKGYVVDQGVNELRARGFNDVFVEAGGDLVASGAKRPGAPWRIGIRGPRPGLSIHARFDATNQAVATSGDYMQPFTSDYRQHHILDPSTGRSSPELASSTVLAEDAATADALATLTMVLGPQRGRELLEDLPGCEGYFISKDLNVTRTTGFVTL